jgi:hypothetical protein
VLCNREKKFSYGLTPNHEKNYQNNKKYVSREKRTGQNHEKMIGAPNQHGSFPLECGNPKGLKSNKTQVKFKHL